MNDNGTLLSAPAAGQSDAPATALNHISEIRLRLPGGKSCVDAWPDLRQDEVVEQVVFFDEIYPHNTETVTSAEFKKDVSIDGILYTTSVVTCKDSSFIPTQDMLPTQKLEAEFLSGALAGQTFQVGIDTDYLADGPNAGEINRTFMLVPIGEKVGEDTIYIPNEYSCAKAGDQFVLKGVKVPKGQIRAAEEQLEIAAKLWAKEHCSDTDVYTCQTDPVYCAQHDISLPLGQRVRLVDPTRFGEKGRLSRIQEYEKDLVNPYKASYTVGDNTPYSRLGTVESSVQQSHYEALPGVVSGNNIYLIRSKYDLTIPTDYNAYSGAASEAVFLSKNTGGTVKANVRMEKDVAVGGDVMSADFRQDAFAGSGFGIYRDANGSRVLEVDKVHVRKDLKVNSLVVNQVTHIGGRQIYSAASLEIDRIEETDEAYRCYMDTRQGQLANRFVAGDQAYCQQLNAAQSDVTKYYWRLVTAAGEDYIDLSKTDCDGEGIPAPGDLLAQVGNRTDRNRQAMYEIDQTAGGAVTQYAGIDSFTLADRNMIGQYYDPRSEQARLYAFGETYIGDRDTTARDANYITFQKAADDDRNRLYISGQVRIAAGSSGLQNLADWSEAQQKIDAAAEAARSANAIAGAVQGDIEVLRNQIDGQVECWFRDYNPTPQNLPASGWDDFQRELHLGDTFTNLVSGYSWRWTQTAGAYLWEQMDAASARALASASASQAALDGRCAVFLRTPGESDHYDVGDLWLNATYADRYNGELLRAAEPKAAGEPFSIEHWLPATRYTDDTAVNDLRADVDTSFGRLEKALSDINADNVFSLGEKWQIRILWEAINGVPGFDRPEDTAVGSYAQVLRAVTGVTDPDDPQPSRLQAFRTAGGQEEFMVQKE